MPIRPKKGQLDRTAEAFLQSGQQPIEVHQGQSIDEKRADQYEEQQERMLLGEASEYGDDLVRYVAMHRELSPEETAWGFCLGLYCARDAYPGDGDVSGGDLFDDVADQANKDLVLKVTTLVTDEDEIARIKTDLPMFDDDAFRRAAKFAENFASFLERKKRQMSVGNRQGAYGMGRAFHNLRQTFPEKHGGSAAFDELARRAGQYFTENKEE